LTENDSFSLTKFEAYAENREAEIASILPPIWASWPAGNTLFAGVGKISIHST
jgi:hypothetical protein